MLYIGIDPGEHTGFAVWNTERMQFDEVCTLSLIRAIDRVRELRNIYWESMVVIFEDARQRTWFPREKNIAEYRGKLMGAGAAKRDARIWEEFLEDYAIPFEAHKPQPHTTKWRADTFERVTGYKGRTSEHARDAALLVFGRR